LIDFEGPDWYIFQMEAGTVVEYIDHKQIICAVVMQATRQKVRLLTEANREASISENRLLHPDGRLSIDMGRDRLVSSLGQIVRRREELKQKINILELWQVLHTENEWIDVETMAQFCFDCSITKDHISAVVRAFFENRTYFKFDVTKLMPNPEDQVTRMLTQAQEEECRVRTIREGGEWLRRCLQVTAPEIPPDKEGIVDLLKDLYLQGKESARWALGKEMLSRAGQDVDEGVFPLLVHLGIWDEDENTDLLRLKIPCGFSAEALEEAEAMVRVPRPVHEPWIRRDLTSIPVITIDGQLTLDFDDAISLEEDGGKLRVGIHISDVACYIKGDTALDSEAVSRGVSIYMPDQRIPMLPPILAEGLLSLRANEIRPAISVLVTLDPGAQVLDYEIVPSLIRVRRQLTYHEVNQLVDVDKEIITLHDLAVRLRQKRLELGAVQISLPEVNVWIDDGGKVSLNKITRESPSRILVSETMILANRLMAGFLKDQGLPAVFRSQPEPRSRLITHGEGTLFQNWMQRRHLSRFVLTTNPEPHSGLGVPEYVTATSPIRKYFDLVTQRQIRGALGEGRPYAAKEIEEIISRLQEPLFQVVRLQAARQRYWILKFLEERVGRKEEAMVLEQRRDKYVVLLTDYMMECQLSVSGRPGLKPEDCLEVVIQKADARHELLAVSPA